MKLRNLLLIVITIVLITPLCPILAQSDSIGRKYYAYAHVYSGDTYTEYVSSIFCWEGDSQKNGQRYPKDYLTAWTKSVFKDHLPDIKISRCACRFEVDSTHYFTTDEAVKSWNLEVSECTDQNIAVVIVTFPDCFQK